MLSKRLIACLDVRDGCVVKGVNFGGFANAGDPAALARRYNARRHRRGRRPRRHRDDRRAARARGHDPRRVAASCSFRLTVGGGIRTEADAAAAIDAGADKVGVNSAALADPALLTRLAARYGSQAVVVAIDAKRAGRPLRRSSRGAAAPRPDATPSSGRARPKSRGAGEILLTSIDRDGTRSGFDCELTAAVSRAVSIPVIASGGAGTFEHFADVFTDGRADAALAASVFHYSEHAVAN